MVVRFLQRLSALTVTIIIVVVAFVVFSVKLALRSNLEAGIEIESASLQRPVEIYRNSFGIPHIVGENSGDVFFGLGFVHAQDRLWQMDLLRRIARGKTARIFGVSTLDADRFFRTLDIPSIAAQVATGISPESKRALENYTAGVNSFIENNHDNLPFEFDALHYSPEPWTVTDCICIERLMAFDMSMSFWTDVSIGEIADSLGVDEALTFIPGYPSSAPTVCDPSEGPRRIDSESATQSMPSANLYRSGDNRSELNKLMASAMKTVRTQLGMTGMCSGSNSWVMSKHERGGKGVVFANDPHLSLGLPPRWYQAHITCPSFNAVGCSIPGVPGIVSGRNDKIAWGITNVMLDDCDFFFEKVDPSNPAYYINSAGKRVKFGFKRDTIEVKTAARIDTVYFDYRCTPLSNVISDATITKRTDSLFHYPASDRSFAAKYVLTTAWTARERSDEFLAALRILQASSWKDFCQAISTWGAPALNFTYADVNGNMGIAPSGLVPKRGAGNANFPHPGWEASYAWAGFHSSNELPRVYNPQTRFVFSANNLTSRSLPFYLSSLWEPSSRAERIKEMLLEYRDYTARDAQFMQMDQTSPNARFVLQHTLPILVRDSTSFSADERSAIRLLSGWDKSMSGLDIAPAVYTAFHERLMKNTFEIKISHEMYLRYAFEGGIPVRKVNEIYADSSAAWFGPDPGFARSRRESCIRRSFRDGIATLRSALGDPSNWQYGKLHRLTLRHPFHANPAFKNIVSRSVPFIGGDATTVNNALWQVHNPFDVYVGASMRLVADMEDSVVYSVVPGGSSGQPMDTHYADQIELWANGGYIPLPVSSTPAKSFTLFARLNPRSR
ncbi:MAG: penicillin acylase family protein [Candidatus Kapaibacterium sp.]